MTSMEIQETAYLLCDGALRSQVGPGLKFSTLRTRHMPGSRREDKVNKSDWAHTAVVVAGDQLPGRWTVRVAVADSMWRAWVREAREAWGPGLVLRLGPYRRAGRIWYRGSWPGPGDHVSVQSYRIDDGMMRSEWALTIELEWLGFHGLSSLRARATGGAS